MTCRFSPERLGSRSAVVSSWAALALFAGCDARLDPVGSIRMAEPSVPGPPAPEPRRTLYVEAESFTTLEPRSGSTTFVEIRSDTPQATDDPDPPHFDGVTGSGYVETLPDTFLEDTGMADNGVNYFSEAGAGPILSYLLDFDLSGTYIVWARAYGGGTKDNTVFFGVDGNWNPVPLQVCGEPGWTWTSALRDEGNQGTCMADLSATLEIPAGLHEFQLSVREDGFEIDRLILTLDPELVPEG